MSIAPFRLRLEDDDSLEHGEWRRIGRSIGAPRFAQDMIDFRKIHQDLIRQLKKLLRLRDGYARHRGRHIKEGAFVHLGHELRAQRPVHGNRQENKGDRCCNYLRFPAESPANDRSVDTHEWPGDGVILL